jgi:hypothetical protein
LHWGKVIIKFDLFCSNKEVTKENVIVIKKNSLEMRRFMVYDGKEK